MSNEAFEKEFDSQEAPAHYSHEEACAWSIGASYGWQAAKADSEREIAELQAHINDLRDALNAMRDAFDIGGDVTSDENTALYKADKSIVKTPAQSLQEHDNEVIEKCAKELEGLIEYRSVIDKIRALKG